MNLIEHVGKVKGRKTGKGKFRKEDRAAKLIAQWPALIAKMEGMVVRGYGQTDQARHAYATLLMMETGIRIGNEGSAEGWICDKQILAVKDGVAASDGQFFKKGDPVKEGDVVYRHDLYGQHVQTFGLTTLLHEHVSVKRGTLTLSFAGKTLVDQELRVSNPVLVRFAPAKGKPGDLWLGITPASLTKFQKRFIGRDYSPKDLRTAKVNLLFVQLWEASYGAGFEAAVKKAERKAWLKAAVEDTADRIGHTPSVCKSSYLSGPMLQHLLNMMDGERTRTKKR